MPDIRLGPWTRRGRRVAYENAWITVYHDDVLRPDGTPGIYGVVSFKTRAVGVVPIGEDGRLLLVGQYRYTLGADSWEIPEGGVPFDEDPLDGARRELAEETGYTAAEWRDLGPFATSNSITDETGRLFVATGLTAGEPHPDGTESLTTRWLTLDEAVAMVERGEITDAMSQIALLRVALERQRR
jgi:8-oxo-dGTP pyrophosphatase MutT (NUDIX family)